MYILGNSTNVRNLRCPFCQGCEHGPEVDFLKALAIPNVAPDLPDKENHWRGVLERGVDANGGVGRAGTTRHETYARPPGQLSEGVGHVGRAAFVAAYDKIDLIANVVKCIQDGQIALPRYAERAVHILREEAVHQNLPTPSAGARLSHAPSSSLFSA